MERIILNWTNLRKAIIITLVQNGKMTRPQLREKLPFPRTTVYDNLVVLYHNNYIKYEMISNGKRGRPPTYWSVIEK